ncbi:CbtB-domain containing protein [Kiloniella laminariae]|uniref:CbtB-domain containing protein n=1 Tax=Kiloniella laminariae TaxID=454162 RepID=A0ABT4LFK9_9PROT|nr:CbtB domain-containing protein [Kiloniella laminariae]MCZ4279877.1 CbtB-domain containing protein [Kiloniella laminariae]
MTTMIKTQTAQTTQSRTSAVFAASFAMFFGVFMVYGVGFAQPAEIHNAAHDTRHSYAFPCH